MCGICGIISFDAPVVDEGPIQSMVATLRHRGPDDSGLAVLGPAAFGQTRLSIIDLSSAGHQPMHTPDGRYTLVYNGELYNSPDLRQRLEERGVAFRGRSDSEVLLHAYATWGVNAFVTFNGMCAAAIWDRQQQRLHIVRDRFGIKPLYFARLPNGLVFGSEIKAILAAGRVARRLHWPALHEYLYYGNALGAHTLFEGIEKLSPGHYLTFDQSGLTVKPYWSPDDVRPVSDGIDAATRRVRVLLDEAVNRHLLSDVPVGVFLSGGVDSSAITAFASRHYPGKLKTYSVRFDFDEGPGELPKARMVAEQFGTDHHELYVESRRMEEVIEQLVASHDEPFADPADIPLFLLCRQLEGKVKVILQGDGGDEIFAGYRRYNILAHERFWRRVSPIACLVGGGLPRGPRHQRAMRFFRTMSLADPALRMAMLMTVESVDLPPTRMLSHEARTRVEKTDCFQRYRELYARFERLDPVQRMLYVDSMVLLPDTFLEKVDKSTMAHSIEVRVPMLDAQLTEYVMGLPAGYKMHGVQKKWILRQALRGVLPDSILNQKKAGLTVPVAPWLRGPLAGFVRSVLLDPVTLGWGLFDRAEVERCIADHLAGRRNEWFTLYKLLQLALWHRRYLAS